MEAQRLLQSPGFVPVECFWLQVTKHCRNLLSPRKEGSEAEQFPGRLIQHLDNIMKGPVALPAPSLPHSALAVFSDWLGEGNSCKWCHIWTRQHLMRKRGHLSLSSPSGARRLHKLWADFPYLSQVMLVNRPENCSDLSQWRGFPGDSTIKNLPANEFDPWVRNIPWKRKWQPFPVFLPGKSRGLKRLAGYSPWGCRVRHNWATK